MNSFWQENGKPIFITAVIVLSLVISIPIISNNQQKEIYNDYINLANHGTVLQGTIKSYKPYRWGGSSEFKSTGGEGVLVDIAYDIYGEEKKLQEEWTMDNTVISDSLIGAHVPVYYLESNKTVPAATEHDLTLATILKKNAPKGQSPAPPS